MPTRSADGRDANVSGAARTSTRVLDAAAVVSRLVVGGVWVVAGLLKLPDPAESVRVVRNYRLLPEAVVSVVGYGLPVFEIVLGLLLVVGLAARAAATASAALLVLFTLGIASVWVRGLDIDCGCFGGGGGSAGAADYGADIARDLLLLAAALLVVVRGPGPFSLDRPKPHRSKRDRPKPPLDLLPEETR